MIRDSAIQYIPILLLLIFVDTQAQNKNQLESDSLYTKKFYNSFKRDLKKLARDKFINLEIGDPIWIPLSLYDAGRSYGVISNYSNYPELPSFNLNDTSKYTTDCMVFGTVDKKKKSKGLYTVQVLVEDVCGLDSLGGKYSVLVKNGHLFEHHLYPFWFFIN